MFKALSFLLPKIRKLPEFRFSLPLGSLLRFSRLCKNKTCTVQKVKPNAKC